MIIGAAYSAIFGPMPPVGLPSHQSASGKPDKLIRGSPEWNARSLIGAGGCTASGSGKEMGAT